MADKAVERWKQSGTLYLWRYLENTRNYPGWHLSADDSFCRSFADLTERLLAARWNAQKTLLVTPPSPPVLSVPNNRGGAARWQAARSLLLKYPKDKVADDHFRLEEAENIITLTVGRQSLRLLNECVGGIAKGNGDYSIGSDDAPLWFWWNLR